MKNQIFAILLLLFAGAVLPNARGAAFTAFTYQGRLTDGSVPANGSYDFEFKLFDGLNSATQRGSTISQSLVTVSNGLFTLKLDFGAQFDGGERWLEIAVQSNGVPPFVTVTPRQQITSAPYAIYTDRAGLADVANQALAVGINGVPTSSLQPNAVTGAKIANGNVVRSVNGLTDALTLAAGPNISLGTVGNTLTISGAGSAGWLLNGNGLFRVAWGQPLEAEDSLLILADTFHSPAIPNLPYMFFARQQFLPLPRKSSWTAISNHLAAA